MENIVHLLGNPLLHITFITHFIFVSFDHNPIEKQKKQLGIFPGIIYTIKEQIQIVLTTTLCILVLVVVATCQASRLTVYDHIEGLPNVYINAFNAFLQIEFYKVSSRFHKFWIFIKIYVPTSTSVFCFWSH